MDDNKQLESEVMAKIKSGQVKLRSKYIFLAEKLGLGSAFALSLFLAVLFFSLVLFYLRASDNLIYLSFGSLGLFAFLESFPYPLVVILIIFILLAGWLIKQSDISYHKPFAYLALGLLAFVLLAGVALSLTNVAEYLHRSSIGFGPMERMFSPFGGVGPQEGNRGVAGRITEVGTDYILIQTPRHVLNLEWPVGDQTDLEVGQFIVAVGEKKGEDFVVQQIHEVDEAEMPMIRNNIHRQFGPLDDDIIQRGQVRKNCLDDCRSLQPGLGICGKQCGVPPQVEATSTK